MFVTPEVIGHIIQELDSLRVPESQTPVPMLCSSVRLQPSPRSIACYPIAPSYPSGSLYSFVIIQLLPHLLYPLALLLRLLAILPCALESQAAQAHVDFVFGVGAVSGDLPEEAFRVAFVKGGDDFCAAYGLLIGDCGGMSVGRRRTLLDFLGMQMGMHLGVFGCRVQGSSAGCCSTVACDCSLKIQVEHASKSQDFVNLLVRTRLSQRLNTTLSILSETHS
jgi:hypothetical protein